MPQKSAAVNSWGTSAGGFTGKGCVGESTSPGTPPWGTGRSSIGKKGSPVSRLKM